MAQASFWQNYNPHSSIYSKFSCNELKRGSRRRFQAREYGHGFVLSITHVLAGLTYDSRSRTEIIFSAFVNEFQETLLNFHLIRERTPDRNVYALAILRIFARALRQESTFVLKPYWDDDAIDEGQQDRSSRSIIPRTWHTSSLPLSAGRHVWNGEASTTTATKERSAPQPGNRRYHAVQRKLARVFSPAGLNATIVVVGIKTVTSRTICWGQATALLMILVRWNQPVQLSQGFIASACINECIVHQRPVISKHPVHEEIVPFADPTE
ncbi:hypothetical protein SCHPADRAFT_888795 [Schizopora paradoxa]|uniref:Uncharacterized protein n=1 Tax=Schizopora paradoxa TaxID=27342 RepID=A0A0H2RTW6_9AGAM|nr:hypothetical protein SCHPADRAFT_888795 [Schizopora paradoxa]